MRGYAERIVRVGQGDQLPAGWVFKQWLGTETGMLWRDGVVDVDVVLVEEVGPERDAEQRPATDEIRSER